MKITAIKTAKILPKATTLPKILDAYLKRFPEQSVLVITSKIVSLCEGRIESLKQDKEKLLERESDYFLPKKYRVYGASGTITHFAFIGASGIDESNASGHYVLLPKNSQKTAGAIYRYFRSVSG